MTKLDYDDLATEYARHRRTYPGLIEHILEHSGIGEHSDVLEVGCGTANHLAALHRASGARGVGIDPSEQMLVEAKEHGLPLALGLGSAETLGLGPAQPLGLPDASFDLIFSVDMLHYVDVERYFANAMRLLRPGGHFCTVTETEYVIRNRQPMATYFPATIRVDLARFHPVDKVRTALTDAGFVAQHELLLESPYELTDASRFADRAYSNLHLITEEEFQDGLAKLRAAVERGPVPGVLRCHAIWGQKPA